MSNSIEFWKQIDITSNNFSTFDNSSLIVDLFNIYLYNLYAYVETIEEVSYYEKNVST